MATTPNGFDLDNSGRRIVVDPVTRIEGHMRCEVNVDDEDFTSTPVAGGKTWCLPSLSFDQTIEPGE